ncbi:leucyl-tRNA synthetase [Sulfolobus islandicus Y.G.57.14]|uniref:Leucine--tRNA ligase n=2 Tax=Saccharolobus islandicus TaxID=43080 RepID=C3NER9_SACI7|nr:leucine--tRNA ligase [Sulfolobus islandicus]ACP45808.1 leucyl-tRNA synthetase [Sulfolobus islandicus Y.G.57.14]ACR42140.1 leucyl-tRNA synthetase [Sulfolobus islandicus M.16.4]
MNNVAHKWQTKWEEAKVYESNPNSNRSKFFTTVAFPYPNSPWHIGHGRTYVTGDILARYKRMRGYNVLFPMAFHYTGTPIMAMADAIAKGDKELIETFKDIYEISPDVIPRMSDPLFMANYFKEDIKTSMREIGLGIDWRREFTTIDPEFSSFVTWQFHKLQSKGYVVKDTHPVGWCPVHHIPVGMHDTKGDVEPEIGEFVLIYFNSEKGIFPAATLRPETIFGATGLWINPNEMYVIANILDKKMILSEKSATKLSFQIDNIEIEDKIKGSKLVGLKVENPITGKYIVVMGADFVDASLGTGVVMSVPAHAPFDYYYSKKILKNNNIGIIPVITVEGLGNELAKDVVEKNNPKNDEDLKKLTEYVYRTEYNKGILRSDLENLIKEEYRNELKNLGGLPVPKGRELITNFLISKGLGRKIFEIMNKPVYCRCGTEIVVKILKDQWFLDYSNEEWKELARKSLSKMQIIPEESRKDFEFTIEWLEKRACARTRGLGTPLPWDKKWIIESLSDSTIYMAFYTISHKIKQYKISPSKLTQEFWDYVMLGIGNLEDVSKNTGIPSNIIKELREEFLYWYPLDIRHSGKDLIPNHLTFFIFNHAAIFQENLWPKAIAVNGLVLYEGKKMSKSLRNIIPLRKGLKMYGVDVMRIAVSSTADMGSDVNFSESLVKTVGETLRRMYELFKSLDNYTEDTFGFPEKWLSSRIYEITTNTTKHMEALELRDAANELLFVFSSDLDEYFGMVNAEGRRANNKLLREVLTIWLKLITPFAPHLAEEIWHEILKQTTFIVNEKWPEIEGSKIDELTLLKHEYMKRIVEDIRSILNVFKGTPKLIKIYALNDSRYVELLRDAIEANGQMKKFMDAHKPKSKEDARVLQKIFNESLEIDDKMKKLIMNYNINEVDVLNELSKYIRRKLNVEIQVEAYNEEVKKAYNKEAMPLRPAIIIE